MCIKHNNIFQAYSVKARGAKKKSEAMGGS